MKAEIVNAPNCLGGENEIKDKACFIFLLKFGNSQVGKGGWPPPIGNTQELIEIAG
jgi:hypothetical protein